MSFFSEWNMKEVLKKIEKDIPLRLSSHDQENLRKELYGKNMTLRNLECMEVVLEKEDCKDLLEAWLWEVMEESMEKHEEGRSLSSQSWGKISQGMFKKFAQIFPPESFFGAFTALCSGKKQFAILRDPDLQEAFFHSLRTFPEERGFRLFLWLFSWLEVPPEFLGGFGECVYRVCSRRKAWYKVLEAVEEISLLQKKRAVAQEIAAVWEKKGKSSKAKNPERDGCAKRLQTI